MRQVAKVRRMGFVNWVDMADLELGWIPTPEGTILIVNRNLKTLV